MGNSRNRIDKSALTKIPRYTGRAMACLRLRKYPSLRSRAVESVGLIACRSKVSVCKSGIRDNDGGRWVFCMVDRYYGFLPQVAVNSRDSVYKNCFGVELDYDPFPLFNGVAVGHGRIHVYGEPCRECWELPPLAGGAKVQVYGCVRGWDGTENKLYYKIKRNGQYGFCRECDIKLISLCY